MGKLEGKVAVITGGSSGMALASAKRFVEEDAYVFITGRKQETLDETVRLIARNMTGVRGDAFGKIGQALAHAFARKSIDVTVASRRPPEALAPQARAIGPTVIAKSVRDALAADTIILAVPFGEHREVAKALPSWSSTR
jgi:NAD(P)-dependent dehydrogenase (short-subunit alcohol dehydrogenase family)